MKLEIKSYNPYNVVVKELSFANECDGITSQLAPELHTWNMPRFRTKALGKDEQWSAVRVMKKYVACKNTIEGIRNDDSIFLLPF